MHRAAGNGLERLLGWPDDDLIDIHVGRLGDREMDGAGEVSWDTFLSYEGPFDGVLSFLL